MLYLVTQIAVTLLFTALIGITMGWLLRGLGASRQTEAIEARWRAHLAQLKERGGTAPVSTETATAGNAVAEHKIAELQKALRQRDEALEALRNAKSVRAPKHADPQALAQQLQETTVLCNQLQGHLAEQKSTADQLKAQIERAGKDRETLIERLRERESEIGRMGQERQHAINTIAKLQKEMRTMRGEQSREAVTSPSGAIDTPGQVVPAKMPPAHGTTPGQGAHATEPASRGAMAAVPAPATAASERPALSQAPPPPSHPNPALVPTPAPAVALAGPAQQQSLPMADTRVAAKPGYQPTWRLSAPQGPKDNLQAIFGIGPKLELQLNRLGIFHFEQIGQFQSNDILWVAHRLKSFPGRIVRDRWIEQAQTLARQKHG